MSTTLVGSILGCFCSSASARYASSDCASKPSSPRLLNKFTMPRPVWVGVAMYVPGQLLKKTNVVRAWSLRESVILVWAGIRGVVSLVAALAVPNHFPAPDLTVFTSFALIISTLVIQGGTLSFFIRLAPDVA
ncbi:cation:proton antiporter [Paraburkholderia sp. NPDC080076]|uniref:cation:proton antiporter domain-containing protein n=1 Tax=Paraburkholderia sp. NPDC080076 TaxID=3390605 RepID=UPI003D019E16